MRLMIALRKRRISGGTLATCSTPSAVAHAEIVLVRLEVNVAGPLVDRLDQDLVDQLDDRGFLGHLNIEIGRIDRCLINDLDILALGDHLVDDIATHPIERLDELVDLSLGGQDRLDRLTDDSLNLIEREDQIRIRCRDADAAAIAADGHDLVPVDQTAGHEGEHFLIDIGFAEVDQRDRELLAEDLEHIAFGHHAKAYQRVIDPLIRGGHLFLD
jgi:hypothetical protein